MRRLAVFVGVLAVGSMLPPRLTAAPETVTGQLIDIACHALDKANTDNVHRGRGYTCAQEGFQVGVLTSTGAIYEVVGQLAANKNAGLAPHMGRRVTISGEVTVRDGTTQISGTQVQPLPERSQ